MNKKSTTGSLNNSKKQSKNYQKTTKPKYNGALKH